MGERKTKRAPPTRSRAQRKVRLAATNQGALDWLREWSQTPLAEDETFWRDFERELRENRFHLHANQ